MTKITINNCVYITHPIYDLYARSKDGKIIHITKQIPHPGNKNKRGYLYVPVRKHGQSGQKIYSSHRFLWECHNGIIPEGKVIDHINDDKEDNRLCNLQLVTQQQNCKKSAKHRDYSFVANNLKNRKCVKAINKDTNEISYFKSMYAINQHLSINEGIVKMVCEGLNYCKSGVSKKDGHRYTFQYIKEEDLPDNYIRPKNVRPKRVLDEEKRKRYSEWFKKEYKCSKCDKAMKSGSKYKHNEKCLTKQ